MIAVFCCSPSCGAHLASFDPWALSPDVGAALVAAVAAHRCDGDASGPVWLACESDSDTLVVGRESEGDVIARWLAAHRECDRCCCLGLPGDD